MSRERVPADPRKMRALAHPIRIELLEILGLEGPSTATQSAERIGQSPSLCSFHLRQLAKYGFVEEAGGASGRDRPWKIVKDQTRFDDVPYDNEGTAANAALVQVFLEREFERALAAAEATTDEPEEWWEASFFMGGMGWLTADELNALTAAVDELISARFRGRADNPKDRPAGSRPVRVLALGYPIPASKP